MSKVEPEELELMTASEEIRTQVGKGRHALSDLAWNVVEKVPDVVDATLEEIHRDGPRAFEQAHEFVEHVVAGAQDRMAVHNPTGSGAMHNLVDQSQALAAKLPTAEDVRRSTNAGLQQAKGIAAHVQPRAVRSARKRSGGHGWKRGVLFLILGLGVGLWLNYMLRAKRRSDQRVTPITDGSGTPLHSTSSPPEDDAPYHTNVVDSGSAGGVYHDQEKCPAGQRIKPENRVKGTDGRSLCKDCQSMAS